MPRVGGYLARLNPRLARPPYDPHSLQAAHLSVDAERPLTGELKRRTLTNLYNARPTWLAQAHERLDDAVLDGYGWPHDIADDDLLARLLALNLEREPVGAPQKAGASGVVTRG